MTEADKKFLTNAMGEDDVRTFDTWQDFGAVVEWGQKQIWWTMFTNLYVTGYIIDPIRFSRQIVAFLRSEKIKNHLFRDVDVFRAASEACKIKDPKETGNPISYF